jgi:hypothetical protein
VSSFHRAIFTENNSLGPDEVSLFHRMSSFRRVAIHMFHCNCILISDQLSPVCFEKLNALVVTVAWTFSTVDLIYSFALSFVFCVVSVQALAVFVPVFNVFFCLV